MSVLARLSARLTPSGSAPPGPRWLPWAIAALAVGIVEALRLVWPGDTAQHDLALGAMGVACLAVMVWLSHVVRARRATGSGR